MEENSKSHSIFVRVYGKNLKYEISHYFLNKSIIASIIVSIILIYIFYIITFNNNLAYFKPFNVVITAPISFLFIIASKGYTSAKRELQMLNSFNEELFRNFINLAQNKTDLNSDLELLKNSKVKFFPLRKMHLDTYDVLKQVFPNKIADMGFYIQNYINKCHEINDFIKTREELGKNRNVQHNEYLKSLEMIDKQMITLTDEQTKNIKSLFKLNAKLLKLDDNKIKELKDLENLKKFEESNGINKNTDLKDTINDAYELKVKYIEMLIFYN